MLTPRDRKIIAAVKNALLKQLQLVVFENGYPCEAVSKSTILSLERLIDETELDSTATTDLKQITDEIILSAFPTKVKEAKDYWSKNDKLNATKTIKSVGLSVGMGLKESLDFCQRNFSVYVK